jgi:hypothetical protein
MDIDKWTYTCDMNIAIDMEIDVDMQHGQEDAAWT